MRQGKHIAYIGPHNTKTNGAVQTINKSRLWHWISESVVIHKSNNHPCSGGFRCPWTEEWSELFGSNTSMRSFSTQQRPKGKEKTGILSTCSHQQFTFWFTTNQTAATMNTHRQTHLLLSCSRKNTQSCSCRLFFRTVSQGLTVASHCPIDIPQLLKPVEGERF